MKRYAVTLARLVRVDKTGREATPAQPGPCVGSVLTAHLRTIDDCYAYAKSVGGGFHVRVIMDRLKGARVD